VQTFKLDSIKEKPDPAIRKARISENKKRAEEIVRINDRRRLEKKEYNKERDVKRRLENPYYKSPKYIKYYSFIESVKDVPCVDCHRKFPPECMDFDHIPERGEKLFNISRGTKHSWDDMLAEIAKCEIICSNCHRTRTVTRSRSITGRPDSIYE
jgi:hypothetical protein